MKNKWYKSKGGWIGVVIAILFLVIGTGQICLKYSSTPTGVQTDSNGITTPYYSCESNFLGSFGSSGFIDFSGIYYLIVIILGFIIGNKLFIKNK